tara:strand:- start:3123 stop:4844 length:1722 start_codon:yes stop_codon:yes gene_type:complete
MFIPLKTRLLSPDYPVRGLRLIVLALCALLPLGVPAAGPHSGTAAERGIGKEEDKEAALDTVYRKPSAVRLERDSTNPIFARKYKGTILDITSRVVVIDSWRGKSFIPRAEVDKIKRAGDAKAIALFEKYRKRARSRDDWVKLEAFAGKQKLIPERRTCIRRLLEKDPSNLEYHLLLGEAREGERWLREEQVETILARGYKLVEGKLEKKPEVKKKKTSDFWKRRQSKKIREVDHLKQALEKKNAHSLWMLISRSGLITLPTSKPYERTSLRATQDLIDLIDTRGNYQWRLKTFLAEYGIPIDWTAINLNKVESFGKKHPGSIHHETKYYHILSTCDEKTVKDLGRKMDIVTKQIYQDLFKFDEKIPHKYILRFYRDGGEYHKNGGPRMAGAHYEPGSKELVGYKHTDRESQGRDPFYSLYHEGWHQYFDFYIPNAPRWFDEGFAEVISPLIIKGGKAKMNTFNVGRSNVLKAYLRRGRIVPLSKLIRLKHHEFYRPDVVGIAYAQAWSFVHFLINFKHPNPGTQKKVRAFYKDYFWELHKGTDPVEACDIVFKDVEFDTLEKAWLKSIHKQK